MKKKIVLRAITDPKFRKMLIDNPEEALSADELASITGGVDGILDLVDLINEQSLKVGTMIFCVTQDPDPNKDQLA